MDQNQWEERDKVYACWLCNFSGMGSRQLHRLTELCGGPEGVYFAGTEVWGKVLSQKQTESLKAYTAAWKPEGEYRKMKEEGIELVTVRDRGYPERLRNIPDAPFGLFYRGRLPEDGMPAVAVIGARECSEYGKYMAVQMGKALAGNGFALVSGMAKGIDGISQTAALEEGGYSIGVLGSGVDVCYPAQNKELYKKLAESGAVISSYPIGTQALGRNFPPRNRIVSGLADAVVVIEARAKSGTLITVDMALEQGREVYVVPGRVTDRLSDGCNRLIKQGAGVVLALDEFLDEIRELSGRRREAEKKDIMVGRECGGGEAEETEAEHINRPGTDRSPVNGSGGETKKDTAELLSGEAAAVYGLLDFTPKSAGEIRAGLSAEYGTKPIAACLMQLVMRNLAVQVSPGHFCRKGK